MKTKHPPAAARYAVLFIAGLLFAAGAAPARAADDPAPNELTGKEEPAAEEGAPPGKSAPPEKVLVGIIATQGVVDDYAAIAVRSAVGSPGEDQGVLAGSVQRDKGNICRGK